MNTVVQYGGFWIRLVASMIDTALLLAIITPLLLGIYGPDYFAANGIIQGPVDFLITWILPLVAVITFWHYKSATPGKMVFNLIIVDAKTLQKPTTGQLIIRYLGYYVSTLFFCLGFLWIAFDKRKQGWHDKIAGTVVIKKNA